MTPHVILTVRMWLIASRLHRKRRPVYAGWVCVLVAVSAAALLVGRVALDVLDRAELPDL